MASLTDTLPRSERVVEEALELKEWYKTYLRHPPSAPPHTTRIESLHYHMCQTWTCGRGEVEWSDYDNPPPWNPKLKDVYPSSPEIQSKMIDILNITDHVINHVETLPERSHMVDSLEEPLEAWHITWVKMLCDESEYAEPDDSEDEYVPYNE